MIFYHFVACFGIFLLGDLPTVSLARDIINYIAILYITPGKNGNKKLAKIRENQSFKSKINQLYIREHLQSEYAIKEFDKYIILKRIQFFYSVVSFIIWFVMCIYIDYSENIKLYRITLYVKLGMTFITALLFRIKWHLIRSDYNNRRRSRNKKNTKTL